MQDAPTWASGGGVRSIASLAAWLRVCRYRTDRGASGRQHRGIRLKRQGARSNFDRQRRALRRIGAPTTVPHLHAALLLPWARHE